MKGMTRIVIVGGGAGGLHRLGATLLMRLDELGAMPGLLPAGASATTLEQVREFGVWGYG